MKKLILIISVVFWGQLSFAQQEAQYTQFMYNKLSLNPGYAGATESSTLTGLYRNQWMGLEGSPNTQLISFNTPLSNRKVGLGLTINRLNISIFDRVSVEGNYAYRFRLGAGYLGVGLQASMLFISADYNDSRLSSTSPLSRDNAINQEVLNKAVPNFGAGVFYQTENFFIGLGLPRFLKNNIDLNDDQEVIGTAVPHAYFLLGGTARLSEHLDLQPQALIKYAEGSPIGIDLNINLLIKDIFTVGSTLRTGGNRGEGLGESLDILLGAQIIKPLFFGLSYDINLSELKNYNNGSIEAILRYSFGNSIGDQIENPRYFN